MEGTSKILRRSVHTFLQNYQYFTTISASLALPFSILFLISQAFFIPSSSSSSLRLPQILCNHFQALFRAAGFPTSSGFFTILSLKLSETVTSSIFALPLTTTFLLIAKSTVIRRLAQVKANPTLPWSLPLDPFQPTRPSSVPMSVGSWSFSPPTQPHSSFCFSVSTVSKHFN
ncbi:uncharacterized protein J3R85_017346 [Psidium guajava]|nr:uncharacterized protein J3R85_017346 [Psidium guajava]